MAFAINFVPVYLVQKDFTTVFNTPDAFYHARRVLVTVHNFPNLPNFDYYISYPVGGYCIWPPLFDFLASVLCFTIFLGNPTVSQIEWLCGLFPIFFCFLVMILLYYISKKLLEDETAAIFSIFIFAILPATHLWCKFGYFDHHIGETLGLLLIFYILITTENNKLTKWLLLGLAFGISLLLWQGAILFIGISFFLLLFKQKFKASISFIIAFIMILPFSISTHYPDSPFSYRGLSLLHLSLLAVAFFALLIPWVWRKSKGLAFLLSALFIVLLFFLIKTPAFIKGIFFLLKKDPWLATIIEFQPLIVRSGYLSNITAKQIFGLAYFVWPLILVILFLENRKKEEYIYFFIFTLITGILAFVGARFGVWFIPFYALLIAFLFKKLLQIFGKKIGILIGTVILIINFSSINFQFYQPPQIYPSSNDILACQWLRDSTSVTKGFLKPTEKPEYGVLCFWGHGHPIQYLAKRPVAASNFGNDVPNFNVVNQFFVLTSEQDAIRLLDDLNCRYVYLVDDFYLIYLASKYLGIEPKKFLNLFYVKSGADGGVYTIMEPNDNGVLTTVYRLGYQLGFSFYYKDKFIPPYRHFRLRFVSGNIRIFEYVKGATIRGRTKPMSPLKIFYELNLPDAKILYYDSLFTNFAGEFITTVPYPTKQGNEYELRIDNKKKFIQVTEENITNGDTINVNF